MLLSKLEPHVVQPSDETADVRLFLQDLEEDSKTVSGISENTGLRDERNGSADDEVKQGFVRLVDFISKKNKTPHFSMQAVCQRAYLKQHGEFAKEVRKANDRDPEPGAGEASSEASQAENTPFLKSA